MKSSSLKIASRSIAAGLKRLSPQHGNVNIRWRPPLQSFSCRWHSFNHHARTPISQEIQQRLFSTEAVEEFDSEELSRRRFEDLELHPKSLKALRRQGLHKLTEIQEKSFDAILSGKDVVGRARTGTGKTISFLLPSLERVVRMQENGTLLPGISILILSPTRELAAQISKEAEQLVEKHNANINAQVIYGGSSRMEDIAQFERKLPTILVATPGRLKDHLASTQLHGNKPFIDALQSLQVLILDETDRLLDMGFRKDVQDILSCLPRKRQTLLFSATLPQAVREVVEIATKPNYQMIDCIQDEDPATQTNARTEQCHVVLPTQNFWLKTFEYLLDLADQNDHKIMVFFPMTSMVEMYAQLFNMSFGRRVWELHGRMHQRERTTISRRFRNASKGILFTSDVSARGVDYPNVTHVVQIGASQSRETYIHRLGRTGRAEKRGKGILILPQLEKDFLKELDGLDIPLDRELNETLATMPPSKKLMNELGPVVQRVKSGRAPKLEKVVHDAYQAMISYYFQHCEDKDEAITTVNNLVDVMGFPELPAIDLTRAKRLNLDGMVGVNIQTSWKDQNWTSGWGAGEGTDFGPQGFGKPYGDFDGKFDADIKTEKVQNSRRNPREGGRREPRSPWRGHYDNRRDPSRWDDKRASQYNNAFSKVGWKKENEFAGKPAFAKKNKPKFERWEAPGEFMFKG